MKSKGGCVDNTERTVLSLCQWKVNLFQLWSTGHYICVHRDIEAEMVSSCWLSCVITIETKGSWQHKTETI